MTLRQFARRLKGERGATDPLSVFDQEWYELQRSRTFPDASAALADYLSSGRVDGLSPHPLFEPAWYRSKDWSTADEDPLITYLREGGAPGPHPLFSGSLAEFLASATPESVRAGLVAAQQVWLEQERLVGPRHVPEPDPAAVAELVAWAATIPLPETDAPLVSVVLPTRNRATHLVAAIASVQSQTFREWELVVIDGGSTDATPRVLELLDDDRIRVVAPATHGSSAARNAGIDAARGRYVAFLDADNIWSPEHLRVAVATLVAKPCVAVHAMSRQWFVGITHTAFPDDPATLVQRNGVDANALVVERQALQQVGGFDPTLPRFAEQDLGLKLAAVTAILPVAHVATTNYQDPSLTDRASLTEPATWTDVVAARHSLDWSEIARAVEQRDRELSVLVPDALGWKQALATVRSVLADTPRRAAPDTEVVVAHAAGTRFDWTMLSAHLGMDERVRLIRTPVPRSPVYLTDLAFAHSRGRTVTVLPAGATLAGRSGGQAVETLPSWLGLTAPAHALAAARGVEALSKAEQADLPKVEVELTKRARAAYAPSSEVGAGE